MPAIPATPLMPLVGRGEELAALTDLVRAGALDGTAPVERPAQLREHGGVSAS